MPSRRSRRSSRARDVDLPLEGLPLVALVGRPNVGKSTLFNRIVGERMAIVEDRPRTTRDRIYADADWNGRRFLLVDTGGLEARPGDTIEARVQEQARLAISQADVIVFLVDAAAGETPGDQEAAEVLRAARAPVLVAVNKADNPRRELEGAEFHRFGWEETHPISAVHGRGVADLLDAIVWALPPESDSEVERKRRESEGEDDLDDARPDDSSAESSEASEPDSVDEDELLEAYGGESGTVPLERAIRVAIVGRPNVGKSSLLNALLGEERAIVSDVPGTTRDAIDTPLEWQGLPLRLVDTAGIRRPGRVASGPEAERYSTLRALKAVTRADVAVLVVDAVDGVTAQDAHVAGYVVEEGVGLVVALNKWDVVEKEGTTFDRYVARIRRDLPFLDFAPVVAISAKTGQRVGRVLEAAIEAAAQRRRRIATGELNRVIREAGFRQEAPAVHGRRPKFYYATQAGIEPPTFILFASDARNVHFSYRRYLENRLRDVFGFEGTPVRLVFRERRRDEAERPARRGPVRRAAGGPAGARAAAAKSRGKPRRGRQSAR